MNKCTGCGVTLQDNLVFDLGYTKNINNNLCERCFKIKHYNEYKNILKSNDDYIKILKEINKTNSLVVLVIDLFNIPKKLNDINQYINNKILLVLTKRDILPKSVYDENLINYFDKYNLNVVDTLVVSSVNNYNFDLLKDKINKYKTNKDVYIVGFTNAGKSTLINKYLYNYTDSRAEITTSPLRSTTIDSIVIDIDKGLTIIDTPGLLDEGSILDVIKPSLLKIIIPKTEIKPITYQIKVKQTIMLGDLLRVDVKNNNSLTFYMSNNIEYKRIYKDIETNNLVKWNIDVLPNQDIVINGLGHIKCVKKDNIDVYTLEGVDVYTRDNLI